MHLRYETEIKLKVQDPWALKRRLGKLGFRAIVKRHFESNFLFDFSDQRLRRAKCLLRLRFSRNRCILTFKGAPVHSRSYKIRGEIETRVENGERLKQILGTLGLRETFRYEKYRMVYAPRVQAKDGRTPELVYDETPIGNYVELEGPQQWIDTTVRQLGYRREDCITLSYAGLYRQKCEGLGKKPGNMVFSEKRS